MKRSVAIAMVVAFGNLGGLIASYTYVILLIIFRPSTNPTVSDTSLEMPLDIIQDMVINIFPCPLVATDPP